MVYEVDHENRELILNEQARRIAMDRSNIGNFMK